MHEQMGIPGVPGVERPADFKARMLRSYMPRQAMGPGPRPFYSMARDREEQVEGWQEAQDPESAYLAIAPWPVFESSDRMTRASYALWWVQHRLWGWQLVVFVHASWQSSGGVLRYCPKVIPGHPPVRMVQIVCEWGEAIKGVDDASIKNIQETMEGLGIRWIRKATEGAVPETDGKKPLAGQRWK